MVLASCVAETVFTGLGGGGFATYYDAATGHDDLPGLLRRRARTRRPALGRAARDRDRLRRPARAVRRRRRRRSRCRDCRPASRRCTSDGAGCRGPTSSRRRSTMPRAASPFAPVHSKVLATVAPAMLIGEGRRMYADATGRPARRAARRCFHPGLDTALRLLATKAPRRSTPGRSPRRWWSAIGDQGDLGPADLAAYEVSRSRSRARRRLEDVRGAGSRRRPRRPARHAARPRAARRPGRRWPIDLVRVLRHASAARRHHEPRGRRRRRQRVRGHHEPRTVVRESGSADLGIHLNSMLGEGELVRGDEVPGRRMGSMMSPLIVFDDGCPCWWRVRPAAAGSGRRCFRSSSTSCTAAWPRPRRSMLRGSTPCPIACTSSLGFRECGAARCEPTDEVVTWPALDSYFGGVAAIGLTGPGADPRRGGDVRCLCSRPTLQASHASLRVSRHVEHASARATRSSSRASTRRATWHHRASSCSCALVRSLDRSCCSTAATTTRRPAQLPATTIVVADPHHRPTPSDRRAVHADSTARRRRRPRPGPSSSTTPTPQTSPRTRPGSPRSRPTAATSRWSSTVPRRRRRSRRSSTWPARATSTTARATG